MTLHPVIIEITVWKMDSSGTKVRRKRKVSGDLEKFVTEHGKWKELGRDGRFELTGNTMNPFWVTWLD